MEDPGRESDHLMLITPERVFYAGLLGRPRKRTPGCCHVYVAVKGNLHLTIDDVHATGELLVTLPNQRHSIASDYRTAISVTLEPESMPNGVIEALAERLSDRTRLYMSARSWPLTRCCGSAATAISPPPNSTRCVLARRCRAARSTPA